MCGRYAQSADMRDLMEQFEITGNSPAHAIPVNWNIAPTNPIYIVRESIEEQDALKRDLAVVSWGLIAPWLSDPASIITQEAQGELATIHSRMPVFMPHNRWEQWLDPKNKDVEHLRNLMVVESPESIVTAHPVSAAVNSVANNGQGLIEPIELGEPETLF